MLFRSGLTGGDPNLLYINGMKEKKISNESLVDELERQIRDQIKLKQVQRLDLL